MKIVFDVCFIFESKRPSVLDNISLIGLNEKNLLLEHLKVLELLPLTTLCVTYDFAENLLVDFFFIILYDAFCAEITPFQPYFVENCHVNSQ